jgi:competence protein ComEC
MRRVLLVVSMLAVVLTAGCLGGVIQDGSSSAQPTEETPRPTFEGDLRVHYLDVGQADATLVEFPNGETMLIDSGDWPQDGDRVIAYLEQHGVDRIDHLVATHPHADHIGGHEAVIDYFETNGEGIGAAYDSGIAHTSQTFEEYLDAIVRHDVDLFTVQAGDEFQAGNATVTFLNPSPSVESDDLHENSVSLVVDYGESEFLFTGDLEEAGEQRLVENRAGELDADLYKAGHHGSRTSSSPPFLEAVSPQTVVISSALDSQYGHPHNETLAAFANRGYQTYWTAVQGNLTVVSNGTSLEVHPEHSATTDAATLREAGPTVTPDARLDPTGFVAGDPITG